MEKRFISIKLVNRREEKFKCFEVGVYFGCAVDEVWSCKIWDTNIGFVERKGGLL